MDESREYTEEEIRHQYLKLVWSYIEYWLALPDKTCRQRLEGLAFSLLVIIDGESELPGFILAPFPHPDDKEYRKSKGQNWFPENPEVEVKGDIAGSLHELFHSYRDQTE